MKVQIGHDLRYFDQGLTMQLDALKTAVSQDWDGLIYVFGREGSGKSTFTMQIAHYLDNTFGIEKVAWTPEQFIALVQGANKYDCIVLDEAYLTFTNANRMNHLQKIIIGLLTMIRSKNLFIIIVSPTFFDLNRYLVIHRAVAAIRVYNKGLDRGYWELYGEESKQKLYNLGRRNSDISVQQADMRGRFTKWFPLDKEEYNKRKNDAVQELQTAMSKKEPKPLSEREHKELSAKAMIRYHKALQRNSVIPFNKNMTCISVLKDLTGFGQSKIYDLINREELTNNNYPQLPQRDILDLSGEEDA